MIVAFDTETELIAERTSIDSAGEINTSPFAPPAPVLVSWAEEFTPPGFGDGDQAHQALRTALAGAELVFHNVAFDYQVICREWPDLQPAFDAAIEAGRVHDTMILEQLIGIASGRYDMPRWSSTTGGWDVPQLRPEPLSTLAQRYGVHCAEKAADVRLTFGAYRGRLGQLPAAHAAYALSDARATLSVYQAQLRRLAELGARHHLSERLQIQAAIVFSDMDRRGLRIDCALAARLEERFTASLWPHREALVAAGLGRWKPAPPVASERFDLDDPAADYDDLVSGRWYLVYREAGGEATPPRVLRIRRFKAHQIYSEAPADFSLDTKAIQARLEPHLPNLPKPPPRRADGTLSIEYDFWREHLPSSDKELQTWLKHEKIKKILTTYLRTYKASSSVFPRWHVLGARSSRTSSSRPNVQNVPKMRYGIRALFLPPSSSTFTIADYSYQELITLAQFMLSLGISGPLLEVIRSRQDVHRLGASLVLDKSAEAVTKDERQGQKALSFGVPGGLGAARLSDYAAKTYGVTWSVDEAAERRAVFLRAFPDIAEYLRRMKISPVAALCRATGSPPAEWRRRLFLSPDLPPHRVIAAMLDNHERSVVAAGLEADRCTQIELPTGFRRAKCRFTEAANTGFQGLAAAVSKRALWRCRQAGLAVAIFCHDEIVVDTPPGAEAVTAAVLEREMLAAFVDVCPDVGPFAKVEVQSGARRWGPATDEAGKVLEL